MELFAVNRYEADNNVEDPDKEQRILKKLQKKIEKRKIKLNKKKENEKTILEQTQNETDKSEVKDDENNEVEPTNAMDVDDTETTPPPTVSDSELKSSSFQVLGDDVFQKKQTVQMVLPSWLAHPTIISNDLSDKNTPLEGLDYVSQQLKLNLQKMGVNHMFPVQKEVIPWVLNAHKKPIPFRPRDICISAPTGSGKTIAYALPIIETLRNCIERKVRALIVLPVNELAVQVFKVFQALCIKTNLSCVLLSKFTPFALEQSQLVAISNDGEEYTSKVDIVISTTGRLVEHIHTTKGFSLKSLKFLVIDEADRIMEQIQNDWLYHLDSHVREESENFLTGQTFPFCYMNLRNEIVKQPHKLLFSATLSQDPEKLQNLKLFQPKLFTSIVKMSTEMLAGVESSTNNENRNEFIGKYTTPAELSEKYCITEQRLKPLTLFTLIQENNWKRFLCFANSGEAAHRLSFVLQNLLGATMKIEELSSALSPALRNSVLLQFSAGKIDGLICSDALSRGIDIRDVDIVISYDAPRHVKTYIHRIGRTARAGKLGTAITLLASHELKGFQDIIKEGGKMEVEELKVTSNTEEMLAKKYATTLTKLQNALQRENQVKLVRKFNEKRKTENATHTGKKGFTQKLQATLGESSIGTIVAKNSAYDAAVPESWKAKNVPNRNERKERKRKKVKSKKTPADATK